jgi:hypothetical protein
LPSGQRLLIEPATVIDGDTLVVAGVRVRLQASNPAAVEKVCFGCVNPITIETNEKAVYA